MDGSAIASLVVSLLLKIGVVHNLVTDPTTGAATSNLLMLGGSALADFLTGLFHKKAVAVALATPPPSPLAK